MYVEKFGGQREDNGRTTSSKPTRSQYRTKAHNNNIAMCAILVAFPQNKHLQGLCNTTRLYCHYGRRRGHSKALAGTFQYNPRQCMQSGLLRRAGVGGRTTRSATFHIVGLTPHKACRGHHWSCPVLSHATKTATLSTDQADSFII